MDLFYGFWAGSLLTIAFMWLGSYYVDSDYQHYNTRLQAMAEMCERHDSTPESFDKQSVTCESGLIIKYTK